METRVTLEQEGQHHVFYIDNMVMTEEAGYPTLPEGYADFISVPKRTRVTITGDMGRHTQRVRSERVCIKTTKRSMVAQICSVLQKFGFRKLTLVGDELTVCKDNSFEPFSIQEFKEGSDTRKALEGVYDMIAPAGTQASDYPSTVWTSLDSFNLDEDRSR